jgi:threonine dehydrogenase-like Zn-dependent dehydrogenase
MKALVYEGPRQVTMQEVPDPQPGADEVVIAVAYSGICGSELGGYLGHNALRRPPLIMGHEFSGVIAAAGERAAEHNPRITVGQRVTAHPLWYCGRCRLCLAGRQNLCPQRQLLGAHQPGAYADFVCVHAKWSIPYRIASVWSAPR